MLYLSGNTGTGKTSLAFRLAYQLLDIGDARYLYSNCNNVWNDDLEKVVMRTNKKGHDQYADTVFVLDEGGEFMKYSDARLFTKALRKLNIYIIVSSVEEPGRRVRTLTVQRVFDFRIFGFPGWLYTFKLNYGEVRSQDWFAWLYPQEIYGIYDTEEFPVDDAGIAFYINSWIEKIARKGGERAFAGSRKGGNSLPALAGLGWDAEAFQESAQEFGDAVSLLGDRTKRRR